jgi:hypothetical protein
VFVFKGPFFFAYLVYIVLQVCLFTSTWFASKYIALHSALHKNKQLLREHSFKIFFSFLSGMDDDILRLKHIYKVKWVFLCSYKRQLSIW